jgi:hypothetical protein
VAHFHVVLTLPAQLRSLARLNPKTVYDLMFRAASKTLLELGQDPKRLGGLLGITAVLHTWTRDLQLHPHLHCIVTAGGLAPDGDKWLQARQDYLFPYQVVSQLFRGKFLAALTQAHKQGRLRMPRDLADPDAFAQLKDKLYRTKWVVYCKAPFGGLDNLLCYLGRYTHRVAISNQRLLAVTDEAVTFLTKDGNTTTVPPDEFIRRFLLHVLPKGFSKIRHYGLLASSNVKTKLARAREIIGASTEAEHAPAAQADQLEHGSLAWQALLTEFTGIDPNVCPVCGSLSLIRLAVARQPSPGTFGTPEARAPP